MGRYFSFIQLVALRTTGWTAIAGGRYRRGMVPRRNVFDPLEPTKEPRWLEVRTIHSVLLESRRLPAGCDLKRVFIVAMLEYIDAGWQLGEFSSRTAFFFAMRVTERRMVAITPTDPGKHAGYGAAHLTSSPGHDD